jgi:hypothetical protein
MATVMRVKRYKGGKPRMALLLHEYKPIIEYLWNNVGITPVPILYRRTSGMTRRAESMEDKRRIVIKPFWLS